MLMPYIGITGFMTREELERVAAHMPKNCDHLLMAGILMSSKTLNGIQNKYPFKYPKRKDVLGISLDDDHDSIMKTIHYNTDSSDDGLLVELMAMMGLFKFPRCIREDETTGVEAVQLNVAWPHPNILEEFNTLTADHFVALILQIGQKAFDMVNNSPEQLANKLVEYKGVTDYILLDPSGGVGKKMEIPVIRDYLAAIRDKDLDINLGCAGGLCSGNLDELRPLIEEFPDLSYDAEGRLRNPDDTLNLDECVAYLKKGLEVSKARPNE
jgi:hypothetical protein